jgi:hypothetical protein
VPPSPLHCWLRCCIMLYLLNGRIVCLMAGDAGCDGFLVVNGRTRSAAAADKICWLISY